MREEQYKVRTPWFPRYSTVRALLPVLDGVPKELFGRMMNTIMQQTGTPQNPVDWSDPDTWIGQRLSGEEAALATRIWHESQRAVNPRYLDGSYALISRYGLVEEDPQGLFRLTEHGQHFIKNNPAIVHHIDEGEGLPQLLAILATKTRAKRGDLLGEWGEFLKEHSKFGTPATIKDTLRRRLSNLIERDLIKREGIFYVITPAGIEHAATAGTMTPREVDKKRDVLRAIQAFNEEQRMLLREQLSKMPPYRFEHLVRDLLEAMGYEDVEVTKESGDKGVDVVATVQFGITTIKEVVQVKRHQGTIGRPVLDQLRGALPYHNAIRGTIITLSRFSQECIKAALFPGAAPIGLIDGDKLLNLLMEHELGIKKQNPVMYEVDDALFSQNASEENDTFIG